MLLEVTRTGRATYYLRYRDKSSRIRQARLGSTDRLGLEQAREKARVMRSQAQMGFNPLEGEIGDSLFLRFMWWGKILILL